MSRNIDPEMLDADDVEYLRVRPTLLQEFELQGYGNPLDPDYPGLVSNQDGYVAPEDEDEEDDEEDETEPDEPDEGEDGDGAEDESGRDPGSDTVTDETPGSEPDYEDLSKRELQGKIDERNRKRSEQDAIKPAGRNKQALAEALREDDQKQAEVNSDGVDTE